VLFITQLDLNPDRIVEFLSILLMRFFFPLQLQILILFFFFISWCVLKQGWKEWWWYESIWLELKRLFFTAPSIRYFPNSKKTHVNLGVKLLR